MCKIKNSKSSEKHTNTIHLIIMHEISGAAWEGRRNSRGPWWWARQWDVFSFRILLIFTIFDYI